MKLRFKIALSVAMIFPQAHALLAQQKEAPALAPPNPEAEKTLQAAGALMQSGKFQEAEPLLKQAAKLAPTSPVPHNLLGFVYEQLKQHEYPK